MPSKNKNDSNSKYDDAKLFAKNYELLQQAVAKLQYDDNITIDDLLPLVDQATEAYDQCKKRLQHVEDALAQRFKNDSD